MSTYILRIISRATFKISEAVFEAPNIREAMETASIYDCEDNEALCLLFTIRGKFVAHTVINSEEWDYIEVDEEN